MTRMTNPDTFALTPEEQDGITIADATENAADPRTKAAVDSIVARFPRWPVKSLVTLSRKPNPSYEETDGLSEIALDFEYAFGYQPVTFIGQLYNFESPVGEEFRWHGKKGHNHSFIGLAYAEVDGSIGHVFPIDELLGNLSVGVAVEYDISRFTRYRNVGIGLLRSHEVFTRFTLAELAAKGETP